MDKEIWKEIPMYVGIYKVSNFGRVYNMITNSIVNPTRTHNGYLRVPIYLNGRVRKEAVHRLVAITFIPNPNNLPQVNHKDENKTNNRVDNLEWCTAAYNNAYGNHNLNVSMTLGTSVTVDDIIFPSISKCAKYLNLPLSTINNYLKGRNPMPRDLFERGLNYVKNS